MKVKMTKRAFNDLILATHTVGADSRELLVDVLAGDSDTITLEGEPVEEGFRVPRCKHSRTDDCPECAGEVTFQLKPSEGECEDFNEIFPEATVKQKGWMARYGSEMYQKGKDVSPSKPDSVEDGLVPCVLEGEKGKEIVLNTIKKVKKYREGYRWDYDYTVNAGYLKIKEGKVDRTVKLVDGRLMIDVDKEGGVLGVEYIHVGTFPKDKPQPQIELFDQSNPGKTGMIGKINEIIKVINERK